MLTQSLIRHPEPALSTLSSEDLKAAQIAAMNRHLNRCFFKVGDEVVFKKPKNKKIEAIIKHIEQDPLKVVWSGDKTIPFYIDVEITTKDTRNLPKSMKTYESKIRLKGSS